MLSGGLPLPGLKPLTLLLKPQLFSELPTCNSQNKTLLATVSDSTTNVWGAPISGGGSLFVSAYCNGTDWLVNPSASGGITALLNPMTTFGDTLWGSIGGVPDRLPGNTSSAPNYLVSQGNGSSANPPFWSVIMLGNGTTQIDANTMVTGSSTGGIQESINE